jgi:plasmid maintenance system antidote protein VapI
MASEIDERMAELCKMVMDSNGWKQKELARAMNIDESEISLLLNKKRRWSRQTIEAFSKATGLAVAI